MKKSELLSWLGSQEWIQRVGSCELINTSDNISWYFVNALEADGDSAIRHKYGIYVANEGTEEERAYWTDGQPQKTMNVSSDIPTYKMITFRTLLASTPLAPSIISKIKAASQADATGVMQEYVSMLSTYTVDGGIDINNAGVQAMIQAMVGIDILTQAEADAVIALADQTGG